MDLALLKDAGQGMAGEEGERQAKTSPWEAIRDHAKELGFPISRRQGEGWTGKGFRQE